VLDVATERLSRAWGTVGHLNGVADTPELRAAFNENLPRSSSSTPAWAPTSACTPSTRRCEAQKVRKALTPRAGRRCPMRCATSCWVRRRAEGDAKTRFAEIQDRLADRGQKFSEHVLDATDGFAYYARPTNSTACRPT
jgi:oligopeptidase A